MSDQSDQSDLRPLPSRPSLEYARKEAKALLRSLRAGDPEALARARARHSTLGAPDDMKLADAQLVFAREHGFASWPRLVRYVGEVERQQHADKQLSGGPALSEWHARLVLEGHAVRHPWAGRVLAAYVPRFYGLSVDEVFAAPVTEGEARLAVARSNGAPSWDVLVERLAGDARTRPGAWEIDPMDAAREAMVAADLDALQRVTAAHPELLRPSQYDRSAGHTLIRLALWQERQQGRGAMRPILDWLGQHGFDRQRELNASLRGHPYMKPADVRALLDQGADPHWVPPNGIPLLEHALLRYKNGDAVDVLAAKVTPRRSLWIAAGLGDVDGVRRFLDRDGRPTPAASRLRPDLIAVATHPYLPPLPDPDDEEILVEALLVAMINGRTRVIDYLASRGAPLNSTICGAPLVMVAAGNGMPAAVEALVRGGADIDLRGTFPPNPETSTREAVRSIFEARPQDESHRRLVTACGMDPDAILAERDARPAPTPKLDSTLARAIALAGDDAARLGQPDVRPENLLIGLLRGGGPPLYFLKEAGRMDVDRFRAELADRVAPADDGADRAERPMHADAQAIIDAAVAAATARRQDLVWGLHLLHALTRDGEDAVAGLLARYGVNAAAVHAEVTRSL